MRRYGKARSATLRSTRMWPEVSCFERSSQRITGRANSRPTKYSMVKTWTRVVTQDATVSNQANRTLRVLNTIRYMESANTRKAVKCRLYAPEMDCCKYPG